MDLGGVELKVGTVIIKWGLGYDIKDNGYLPEKLKEFYISRKISKVNTKTVRFEGMEGTYTPEELLKDNFSVYDLVKAHDRVVSNIIAQLSRNYANHGHGYTYNDKAIIRYYHNHTTDSEKFAINKGVMKRLDHQFTVLKNKEIESIRERLKKWEGK